MIVGIHQPNFAPWLGFFYKLWKSDQFIFLDHVQFSKNSYQNRVQIKTANGPLWLTVPVEQKFGQKTCDVLMDSRSNWREKHLRTLEMNYKKAPFFCEIFPLIEATYREETRLLVEFNLELIKNIVDYLQIQTVTLRSTKLGASGEADEMLIGLVQSVNGTHYLSGRGGANYQDPARFEAAGLTLIYSEFLHPTYPQLWGDFLPGLSIIDLLFNYGKHSLDLLAPKKLSP